MVLLPPQQGERLADGVWLGLVCSGKCHRGWLNLRVCRTQTEEISHSSTSVELGGASSGSIGKS